MVAFSMPTPVLRMFDEAATRGFYVGFLGFAVAWERRFEETLPLYMEVARGDCTLHLSQHHGDCTPGGAVRILVTEIETFHADLLAKDYGFARPGCGTTPWNTREVTVADPAGNRLTFFEPIRR